MCCLTAAFGIYLAVQQLAVMPYLSRWLSKTDFAFAVLFVTVFNIVGSVIGEECGNTLLIKDLSYRENGFRAVCDISRILLVMSGLLLAAGFAVINCFSYSWQLWSGCIAVTLLCAWRFYAAACYRLRQEFSYVLYMNAAYTAGLVCGILLSIVLKIHWINIFFAGEIAALLFIFADGLRRSIDFICLDRQRSGMMSESAGCYCKLALISAVLLTAGNFERFILISKLDALALNIFYGASVCSKMIFFLGNPLYSYLLARFSSCTSTDKDMLLKKTLKLALLFVPFTVIGAWILSYIGLRILYPFYLAEAEALLLPLSLSVGIGFLGIMLRPLVMRFCSQTLLLLHTLIYGAFLWISMAWACGAGGLTGAVWALALSQLFFAVGLAVIAGFGKIPNITE